MRILLAEDEKDLCEALKVILKHSNYSVDTVHNGEDAEAYLMTGIYDAAILDIMMPEKDGFTVLKNIREKRIDTPVLILTAKSGINDRVKGLDMGADDYLTKPFATKELLARLRAIIRRKTDNADNTLRFGNTVLDPLTFEIRANDKKEQLSNREFQMLQMLMVNPGNIISVERFMEKIWGYDSDAQINVVWVYISYLRKKLTAIDADFRISVVRNIGYRLQENKK
ncbi:MAG: response regulator transcription factor [Clostridia bacterium]|nr:response regulator transcription factor [Clostridia bacterium]